MCVCTKTATSGVRHRDGPRRSGRLRGSVHILSPGDHVQHGVGKESVRAVEDLVGGKATPRRVRWSGTHRPDTVQCWYIWHVAGEPTTDRLLDVVVRVMSFYTSTTKSNVCTVCRFELGRVLAGGKRGAQGFISTRVGCPPNKVCNFHRIEGRSFPCLRTQPYSVLAGLLFLDCALWGRFVGGETNRRES